MHQCEAPVYVTSCCAFERILRQHKKTTAFTDITVQKPGLECLPTITLAIIPTYIHRCILVLRVVVRPYLM